MPCLREEALVINH